MPVSTSYYYCLLILLAALIVIVVFPPATPSTSVETFQILAEQCTPPKKWVEKNCTQVLGTDGATGRTLCELECVDDCKCGGSDEVLTEETPDTRNIETAPPINNLSTNIEVAPSYSPSENNSVTFHDDKYDQSATFILKDGDFSETLNFNDKYNKAELSDDATDALLCRKNFNEIRSDDKKIQRYCFNLSPTKRMMEFDKDHDLHDDLSAVKMMSDSPGHVILSKTKERNGVPRYLHVADADKLAWNTAITGVDMGNQNATLKLYEKYGRKGPYTMDSINGSRRDMRRQARSFKYEA